MEAVLVLLGMLNHRGEKCFGFQAHQITAC